MNATRIISTPRHSKGNCQRARAASVRQTAPSTPGTDVPGAASLQKKPEETKAEQDVGDVRVANTASSG